MTNFDTFLSTPQFSSFAPVAVSAERILPIDPSACVLNCRRAMEFAVKWMYSVDKALVMPYQDTLVSLMNTEDFRDIVGADIWRRMDLIRRMGNNAAHTGKKITQEQAALCLENLYVFLDFVAYCYGENYTEGHFDPALLTQESEASAAPVQEAPEVELAALMAENAALKEELTARRAEQQQTYVPKPLDLSEYKTRKLYIDTMLTDAGWTEGKDWLNEVELPGMPNKSEVVYADYVLCGDDGRPLAVVEAKREAFWKDTLTCERLLVALDCNEDAGSASGQHGVDECYVPCRLRTPLRGEGHTLIPVRPVSVSRKGVIVEPLRP